MPGVEAGTTCLVRGAGAGIDAAALDSADADGRGDTGLAVLDAATGPFPSVIGGVGSTEPAAADSSTGITGAGAEAGTGIVAVAAGIVLSPLL